jgi:hypothetical protein
MTYYGYKFESVCTENGAIVSVGGTAAPKASPGAPSKYYTLVQHKLQDLVMVIAAQVDLTRERPVSADTPPPLESLLELKAFK